MLLFLGDMHSTYLLVMGDTIIVSTILLNKGDQVEPKTDMSKEGKLSWVKD